METYVGPKAIL